MNIFLKLHAEEIGRFLLAYNRGIFPPRMRLGASFLFYYGLMGYDFIRKEKDDDRAIELIKQEFIIN